VRTRALTRVAAGLAWLLVGCFEGHDRPEDGGPPPDADGDPCRLGIHTACTPGCPPCPSSAYCDLLTQVCDEWNAVGEQDRGGCWYFDRRADVGGGETYEFCANGWICATDTTRRPARGERLLGRCVHPSYCAESRDFGIELTCVYSDFSVYVDGPPEVAPEDCEGGHPQGGLCGPSCTNGGCPYTLPPPPYDFPSTWGVSCVGVTEDRGLGACSIGGKLCRADHDPLANLEWLFGEDFSCLNLRLPGGAWDTEGWPVFADTCRLYADRYPDDARCLGGDLRPEE
jgi:hypothetical protein